MAKVESLLLACALLLGGCAVNLWGSICRTDNDCESDQLICAKAQEANISGRCLYPQDEVSCGTGTVLSVSDDVVECVVDPALPPDLECGAGTVETNHVCVPE